MTTVFLIFEKDDDYESWARDSKNDQYAGKVVGAAIPVAPNKETTAEKLKSLFLKKLGKIL